MSNHTCKNERRIKIAQRPSFLRSLREMQGFGVREAGKRSGLSAATISRVERMPHSLKVDALLAIARAYKLDDLAGQLEVIVGEPR